MLYPVIHNYLLKKEKKKAAKSLRKEVESFYQRKLREKIFTELADRDSCWSENHGEILLWEPPESDFLKLLDADVRKTKACIYPDLTDIAGPSIEETECFNMLFDFLNRTPAPLESTLKRIQKDCSSADEPAAKKKKKEKTESDETFLLEKVYERYLKKSLTTGKSGKSSGKSEGEKADSPPKPEAKLEDIWVPKAVPKQDKKEKKEKIDPIVAREGNRRENWDEWQAKTEGQDIRLRDTFYRAGDSWGDKAFADMSCVKGKSFVKQMQKKKRSSWRGGGAIDMGVNSLFFDSD